MGSDSDLPVMTGAAEILERFSIPFEIEVTSAHRSPARTHEYASTAIAHCRADFLLELFPIHLFAHGLSLSFLASNAVYFLWCSDITRW